MLQLTKHFEKGQVIKYRLEYRLYNYYRNPELSGQMMSILQRYEGRDTDHGPPAAYSAMKGGTLHWWSHNAPCGSSAGGHPRDRAGGGLLPRQFLVPSCTAAHLLRPPSTGGTGARWQEVAGWP